MNTIKKFGFFFIFVLILLYLKPTDSQESTSSQFSPDLLKKVLHEINKRVNSGSPLELDSLLKPTNVDFNNGFKKVNSSIIRTQESINAGALFIKSVKNAKIPKVCLSECLKSKRGCDLAVHRSDVTESACYLFNCSGHCLFTHHPGFDSYHLIKTESTNDVTKLDSELKHEAELAGLNKNSQLPAQIPVPSGPPVINQNISNTQQNKPAPLFGDCRVVKDCAGQHTECVAGYCVCKHGYHPQEQVCRKDCTRFEFECANNGQPMAYPQCIAIYDKCDTINHCADSSDEQNCKHKPQDDKTAKSQNRLDKDKLLPPKAPGTQKSEKLNTRPNQQITPIKADNTPPKELSSPPKPSPPTPGSSSPPATPSKSPLPIVSSSTLTADHDKNRPPKIPSDTEEQTVSSKPDSSDVDRKPSSAVNPTGTGNNKEPSVPDEHPGDNDALQNPSAVKPTGNEKKPTGSGTKPAGSGTKPTESDNKPPVSDNKPSGSGKSSDSKLSDSKSSDSKLSDSKSSGGKSGGPAVSSLVDVQVEVDETVLGDSPDDVSEELRRVPNRGAVVALALGLALTALLLLFVGCRLRNVKRRLRHGRPLNSNEADYLINGMYL